MILSAITGTAVYASISGEPSTIAKVLVGTLAMVAAALTSLQSWHNEKRSQIKAARDALHGVHVDVASTAHKYIEGADLPDDFVEDVRKRLAAIDCDPIPSDGRRWREARDEVISDLVADGFQQA